MCILIIDFSKAITIKHSKFQFTYTVLEWLVSQLESPSKTQVQG